MPNPSKKRKKRRSGAKAAAQPSATAPATALPANVARAVAEHASGDIRRRSLRVDQGLLDQARARLGIKTETEAVELGLGALLELAEFRTAMLDGFDRLMAVGGLRYVEDEEMDLSGFTPGRVGEDSR